jgi:MFS family permease
LSTTVAEGLIGLTAGIFVTVLDSTVLTVAAPALIRDLSTDLRTIEWVIAGYSLVFAGLLILSGRVGDIVGHRRMVVAGLVVFAGGSLLAARAQGAGGLILGDAVLEGIGAAMMGSSSLSLVNAEWAGRERDAAFALYGVMGGAAGAFGPVVGGWLTTDASWRWAFGINVALSPWSWRSSLSACTR